MVNGGVHPPLSVEKGPLSVTRAGFTRNGAARSVGNVWIGGHVSGSDFSDENCYEDSIFAVNYLAQLLIHEATHACVGQSFVSKHIGDKDGDECNAR